MILDLKNLNRERVAISGLLAAKVGSAHAVRVAGRSNQIEVIPLHEHDGPPPKAYCITCARLWPDVAALAKAHDHEALKRAGSAHVWCYFVRVEPLPPLEIPADTWPSERMRLELENLRRTNRRLLLLSSEAWIDGGGPKLEPSAPPTIEGGEALDEEPLG